MAGRIKGITINIEGNATKLQTALKGVNSDLRATNTALRDVNKLLKFDPGNADLLKQKQEYLAKAIDDTKEKLEQEKAAMEQLKAAGDTQENQEQQRALTREIAETEQKLKSLEAEARKSASVLGSQMQAAGQKIQGIGKSIANVGRNLSMYVTAPIAGIGAAAVKTTADFDSSMSKVMAVSGATGDDFQKLRDKAREMGATTKFSASDAADALNYMAMAGWKTEDMLSGIEGIMNLAAASGEDLATTSDIVTDALTAFGESADQSGRLADIMAAASSNANTNVSMMGETFKYFAPVAGSLGMSMEDAALATGLMANAGIKASTAGTSLRTGLTNLVKPTKEMATYMERYGIEVTNSDGSMKSLRDIMIQLRSKMGDLSESEQAAAAAAIFGRRAMSGWLAVINASDEDFNQLANAIDNSNGVAKSMAEIMQDNLGGQLTILKSQLQEAAISIGDSLVPMLRKAVEWVQNAVDKFNSLDDSTKENIVKIGLFAAALGPALTAIGMMTQGVGALVTGVGKAITKVSTFSGAVGAIPFVPFAAALTVIAGGFAVVKEGLEATRKAVRDNNEELYKSIDAAEESAQSLKKAGDTMGSAFDSAAESIESAGASSELARHLVDQLDDLAGKANKSDTELLAMKAAVGELNTLFPELQLSINETTGELSMSTEELRDWISTSEEAIKAQAYQKAIQETLEAVTAAEVELIKSENELNRLREQSVPYEEAYADAVKKRDDILASLTGNEEDYMEKVTQANMIVEQVAMQHNDAAEAEKNLLDQQQALKDEIADGMDTIGTYNEQLAEFETATDDSTEATEELGEGLSEVATIFDEFGNVVDEETGELIEFADAATEAYMTAYEEAKQSLEGQIGLFEKLEEQTATSFDTINENLAGNTATYEQWTQDLQTMWDYAVSSGDESTRELVKQLANLGVDGAAEVRNFAQAVEENNTDVIGSITKATGELKTAQEKSASIQAQILTDTVLTTDGVVSAYDAAGKDVHSLVESNGKGIESSWSGTMDSVKSVTDSAMGDVTDEVEGGMSDAERAISGAEGSLESAADSTFDKARVQANVKADAIGSEGGNAMRNFEDGMWSQSGSVESAAGYIAGAAGTPFSNLASSGYGWGSEFGSNFASGISDQYNSVANAASSLASAASDYLHFSTPDKGPLRHSDKWGGELADLFAAGMMGGVRDVQDAANALAGAAALQAPVGTVGALTSSGTTGNVINLDVTVNPAPGMDERMLADYVIDRLNFEVAQEEAVFA